MIDFTNIKFFIAGFITIYGIFLMLTSSIGMLRMPDLYTKIHASSLFDSMAMPMMLLATSVQFEERDITLKVILITLITFIINPTSSYCISQAALYSGLTPQGNRR